MYFLSVSSSLPLRKAVFGVWPMARNTPVASTVRSGSPTVLASRAGDAGLVVAQHFGERRGSRGF